MQSLLLVVFLCRNALPMDDCGACSCCKNGQSGCDQSSGNCHDGCINGFFGQHCTHACKSMCLTCTNLDSCSKCKSGYFGTDCAQPCMKNCQTCVSSYHCMHCNNGYFDFENSCNKCPENCLSCTSSSRCTACKDGFYNDNHNYACQRKCRSGCLSCKKSNSCTKCKDGSYSNEYTICNMKCNQACKACVSDTGCTVCETGKYGSTCQYKCGVGCNNRKCDISTGKCNCVSNFFKGDKCDKCVLGKYGIKCDLECSVGCAKIGCKRNGDCYKALCKHGFTGNKCKQCLQGFYGTYCNETCPVNCLDCTKCFTCKPGFWGIECHNRCPDNCERCGSSSECDSCSPGYHGIACTEPCPENCKSDICTKFSPDCTQNCSKNCNATYGLRLCAKENGACLNGCVKYFHYGTHCDKSCSVSCKNLTCDGKTGQCLNGCVVNFYGGQCDQMCSVNCVMVKHGRSCDESKGHCFAGCVDGFYGNKCDFKCSNTCVNSTCKRESGHCLNGCLYGYQGLNCSQSLKHTEAGKTDKTVIIGAAGGAAVLVTIVIVVILVIVFLKRRRNTDKTEKSGRLNASNVENTAVGFREMFPIQMLSHHNDEEAIYAMPNEPKIENEDTRRIHKNRNTKAVSNADIDNARDMKAIADNQTAVYENNAVRYFVPRISAKYRETLAVSVHSELEIEEDPEALKDSKKVAQSYSPAKDGEDTYYNMTAEKKRKIMLNQLADFVSKKEMVDFLEDFRQFPTGLTKPHIESQKRENISKNRYKGIYPYDETRVVLKEGDSDYINASYIDGYIKRRGYIASVGPTYKYMGDMSAFWRMVWQEKVANIVMLTNLIEAGITKCNQYWPDKDISQLYGDVQVTCQSEEIYADYTVRFFVAQKGSEKRPIGQVHFTAWPDNRIPDGVTSLIEVRQKVNSIKTKLDVPLLVHCSAGIGRTGTYIALDRLTIEGEVEGGVDIYACVRNMREQRVNMVQTAEQYRYLHNALVHILTFDSKAVELSKFSEYMSTHAESHFEETFHKIQSFVESRPDDEIDAVKRNKTLKDKNREGADIPGDCNRPRLYLNQHADSSDYINAVYINGFKSRNRYLIAQTPLPDTVDDFLRLIVQENVSSIIDMESNMTKNKNVGSFYPDDNKTLKKGSFTIKSEPGEKTDQYICRKLKILHNKKSKEIIVNHIQFTKWSEYRKTPDEPAKFVQFVKDIELKYYDGEVEGPVLVQCLTGAEKCGLFCVVSILMEKVQIESEISVVNTVRQIKYRRPMSIPNKEQYVFCYQCLNEYLRSSDTYANFGLKV